MINFEAAGDLAFGTEHSERGKCCEILWMGQFPDLQKAMYWGAKKELEASRKRGFHMASRDRDSR